MEEKDLRIIEKFFADMPARRTFLAAMRRAFCQLTVPSEGIDAAYHKGRCDVILSLENIADNLSEKLAKTYGK
jgi:hypothetical protein